MFPMCHFISILGDSESTRQHCLAAGTTESCCGGGDLPPQRVLSCLVPRLVMFMALGPPMVSERNCRGVEALQSGLISAPRCGAGESVSGFINRDDHFLWKLRHNLDCATSLLTTFQWFHKNKTMILTWVYKIWSPASSPTSLSVLCIHWLPCCYSEQLKPLLSFP